CPERYVREPCGRIGRRRSESRDHDRSRTGGARRRPEDHEGPPGALRAGRAGDGDVPGSERRLCGGDRANHRHRRSRKRPHVTALLGTALRPRGYSGEDWTCTIEQGGLGVSCTRTPPFPPAGSGDVHSDITVTVDVSPAAPDPVSDTASVAANPADEDLNPAN